MLINDILKNKELYGECFIIGGESIYNNVFINYIDYIKYIYITRFNYSIDCIDKQNGILYCYFPNNLSKYKLIKEKREYSNVEILPTNQFTSMDHTYLTYIHENMYNYQEYQSN